MQYSYLIYDEVGLSVVPAQLRPLARYFSDQQASVRVFGFVSLRDYVFAAKRRAIVNRYIDTHTGKSMPLTLLPKLGVFISVLLLGLAAGCNLKGILHCRGPVATRVALLAKRWQLIQAKVIFDVRGVAPEEWEFANGYGKRFYRTIIGWLTFYEAFALHKADGALFVTQQLQTHFENKYRVQPKHSLVVPCYLDSLVHARHERAELDQKLVDTMRARSLVMVYSGSFAPWQMAAETVQLFRAVCAKKNDALLAIFTTHQQQFRHLLGRYDIGEENYVVRQVPSEQLGGYFKLASLGVMLRQSHVLNEVAFPVKFAEYLYAGLPVLTTEAVPACAAMVKDNQLGVVVDPDVANWVDAAVQTILQWLRENAPADSAKRCHQFASQQLSFDRYAEDYNRFFEAINSR